MPETINEVQIVDLNRSELDKGKSNIDKNIYVFKPGKKVYVKRPTDYLKKETRHPYFFHWGRQTVSGKEVADWKIKWGYDFVTKEDKYWPEGVPRNSEGHYQWGDAVLMKIPVRNFLKKREKETKKANRAPMVKMREFKDSLPKEAQSDELLEDIQKFL